MYGTFGVALQSNQTAVGLVTGNLRPKADIAGVANVRTDFKSARINTEGYLTIDHGGTSVGDAFSVCFTYYTI